MVKRFWIILTVVVVGLIVLFIATKPEDQPSTKSEFSGDAKQLQSDDHIRNGKDKKVTLIEYGDFQCPSCGAYYPILKSLEQSHGNEVSFVFRHFPLSSIHPNAFAAARAAEAAGKQGEFFVMHDKLYETQQIWGQAAGNQQGLFEKYAEELNLNIEQFKKDYASEEVAARINRDISSGKQFKITGTPTFVLNGQKITTPRDQAGFAKVLNEAITKAGGTPPPAQ